MTIFSAAMLLFLVIDPLGNIPFFLTSLKHIEPRRQQFIVIRELFIALGVLIFFLFTGQYLLHALDITEPSLTLAGGIILFLIALKMIFPPASASFEPTMEGEPFIVPLAIPYVAGPSALAAVLFIMNRDPGRWLEWLVALLLAWLAFLGSALNPAGWGSQSWRHRLIRLGLALGAFSWLGQAQ